MSNKIGSSFCLPYMLIFVCMNPGCYDSSSDSDASMDTWTGDALADPLLDRSCSHPVCDILPQCGCPEAAMCTLDGDGERVCARQGGMGEGVACLEFECASGLLCDEE